ncbi:hypothetical protein C7H19_15455 [Aphanothece hegewaldii CCALA 016]|uniref:Calcium-binding protein n=1 Tax=Aphanothece hegewaldii CCALA 016 TaxID=2107694 RepID=A0A2T1LVQ9_9CHRO|nr:calcium-binding protein [Aphanothece hegewaldii]PSF35819.1 hypothetical protein C7H19_15455 [Aphanothece hegewaldii CCALA 016]
MRKFTLIGGKGDDTYIVDADDVINEKPGEGTDTIVSSVSYVMTGNYLNNLTLTGSSVINGTGNSYNNVITGNTANNILSGGAGIDTLIGGTGNDTYIIDSTTDVITEVPGEGTDTIVSSVSYVMTDNYLNNLTLTGTSGINATGNSYDNVITGNTANNILVGGGGLDTLTGGGGSDRFRFNAKSTGIDQIEDFSLSQGDRIEVSRSGFGASSVTSFSYNSTTGDLSFNSTVFAELDAGLAFQVSQQIILI